MKKIALFFLLIGAIACKDKQNDFTTLFEKSKGTETPEYEEVIEYYQTLSKKYREISMFEIGTTDTGKPLHVVVLNTDGKTSKKKLANSAKIKILINNGIHPGESDGIDASMLFLRDIVRSDSLKKQYQNALITIIPVYNIGGALFRNSYSRANQNGPKEYGFRGNARNYDLNRDFIKTDTKNATSFAKIFHLINPDIFIDNHVSNGADYQYAITHLFTQHNKLGGVLGNYLEKEMRPYLESSLAKKNIPITPYVNVWGSTPEKGWSQFFDSPRYSTGYTSLFNTLGLMVETHMLKPYKIRVEQTYALLFSILNFAVENNVTIKNKRKDAIEYWQNQTEYPIHYRVDRANPSSIAFKGYEGNYIDSKVTNGKRLFYDKSKPYEKEVDYFNNFTVSKKVQVPEAYILKQGWHKIIERLNTNNIKYSVLEKDTVMLVLEQHIESFETRKNAYEGHYLHFNTVVKKNKKRLTFSKGDLLIPTRQQGIRYLLETLEAEATDSFFNWNFFDTILQQKEGFSSYVFEDIAFDFLQSNPEIKVELDKKIKIDTSFAKNPYQQLYFIYQKTPHYEEAHLRLPIYKLQ